jgi:AcrR family transcriptional regulator
MALVETDAARTTPARILDATFRALQDFGLSRLTVEDVAQRAGLSRQTVYRYFPSKDHLMIALVSREEERMLDGVRAAFVEHDDLATAVERSTAFVLELAREHPLLDRLLESDQQAFLPYVTTRALPAIVRARETMLALLMERVPDADEEFLRTVVDGTTRAIVSYMITPSDRSPDEIADSISVLVLAALRPHPKGATR